MLICVDPGHGGADPGAAGNGLREKDLTLDIALRIAVRLREHGFDVLLTRTDDRYIGLSERAQMANAAGADYFLSVHINAGGGTGFESYIQLGYDSGETGRIRSVIHARVAEFFAANDLPDRGRKQADLAVCRESAMPAALLEYGLIDSGDAAKLADTNFRQGAAEATVRGLCEAFGIVYTPPAGPAPKTDWEDHEFREEIRRVMDAGIMRGYDDRHFGPDDPLTRGQAAAIICRLIDRAAKNIREVK